MSANKQRVTRAEITPVGSWRSPHGKFLSKQDQFSIQLSGEDLAGLHRAIDAATSHLDEARGSEERVPFAERLVRIREQGHDDRLTVKRTDLHVLHQALHVAAGHVDDSQVRGPDNRTALIGRLARIRRMVIDAMCDHDGIPKQERHYG
jgi:hypothetical protein